MIAAREARLDVEELAVIDDRRDELVHVVRLARASRGADRAATRRGGRSGSVHGQVAAAARRSSTGRTRGTSSSSAMQAASSANSTSPTPLFVACTFEPPSSCSAMSSPGHGLHERRAAERHRADALHHRHEVGEARDVRRARRARADHRRDLRDDAAHVRPARGRGAPSRRRARSCRGGVDARIDARAARSR